LNFETQVIESLILAPIESASA